jgi:hypothetical protein
MDRVETLIQQLQQQFLQQASAKKLLLTVQMLQHELLHLQAAAPATVKDAVVVSMPLNVQPAVYKAEAEMEPDLAVAEPEAEPEKVFEVLQVDEADVEAELEEIKRNATTIQQITTHSKPALLFELGEDEIPTLALQSVSVAALPRKTEVNQAVSNNTISVNDILKAPTVELSDRLTDVAVRDLRKAIGINDRFLYINELFRGDEVMYERSIKTINSFSIFPEAEYWIRRELKTKLGWVDAEPTVKQFDQLVKRRFS